MSALLLSIIVIEYSITILLIDVNAIVRNCNTGEDCVMQCIGTEACLADYIKCPDDYACRVDCSGNEACWGAVVDATRSIELNLLCGGGNDYACENIDVYCPPNINGVKKCHISGTNAIRGCSPCVGEYNDIDNSLNFYARNGWLDTNFSGYVPESHCDGCGGGQMHCLDDYNANVCTMSSTDWTCSDSGHVCNMATNMPTTAAPTTNAPTNTPTTNAPTTSNPTTSIPTTVEPTTAMPSTTEPTTATPTTFLPTTSAPSTHNPTTSIPTTAIPTSSEPTTTNPTSTGVVITIRMGSTSIPTTTSHRDGMIDIETTDEKNESDELDEKKSEKKAIVDRFSTSPWMLISACLFVVVICLICVIVMVIVRNRKTKGVNDDEYKDTQPVKAEMIKNVEMINTNSPKQNVTEFERVKSLSNEMMDVPIVNNDEFIVDVDDIITVTFPENKYTDNGNDEFIITGNDEVAITHMTYQNEQCINNEQNHEFIVEDDDENNIITPTLGENHEFIVDPDEDEEEHAEGTDEDNIITSDVNNMMTDMGDEGDKENAITFTID